jgi:glycosyltransferase involved in cell wall biosynthesis
MTSEDRLSHTRGNYSPSCSVIVCTRNRPTQLHRCLTALANLNYPDYEVVVVDNAPRDQQTREVAARWGVRYILEPVPGVSRARNRGALACESEVVAYLDDDAVADREWLTVLAGDFADPLVAAVTGAILPLDRGAHASPWSASSTERSRQVVDRQTSGWFKSANFGELGDGSNMVFRRSAFDIWPGFDEKLGRGTIVGGGEEHYAFFTLIERGFRIVHNPEAIVRHPDPATADQWRQRHLELAAFTGAYITRLAVEHPSFRVDLARYVIGRLRAKLTASSGKSLAGTPPTHPLWLSLPRFLCGPWIYLRSRISHSRVPRQVVATHINQKASASAVSLSKESCRLES